MKKTLPTLLLILAILAVGTALAVAVMGMDRRPTDAALLRILHDHRAALTQVAEGLSRVGSDARIDLNATATATEVQLAAALRTTGIGMALHDPSLGGVAFPVYSEGLSISGAEKGLLYRSPDHDAPPRAQWVPDLETAFNEQRRGQKKDQGLDVLLMRKVDERWALYLETF